ncbi:uncharacterized protein LOC116302196 [Actinia tenebrosa]|uniref:Uncharacterized protein LOC116302196 n=1 Tax=Actinia tenebrosa TaxID=6105 RepID=A0A6P8IKH2_ACTTE|nr:uncharacterized protein LOC116302196 [Actinia tenebrosa]
MAAHYVTGAKTDEIFTNLTVYYADKKQEKKEQAKDLGRSELLQGYTKRTMDRKVEKYENVFNDMKGENPKLLLIGKAGIGKTFLCEKVIRDWSMNRIFQNENTPNIQFAYLLKFRQLSKQGDKEINLQELLNCSPLLDDNSVIDDSLFEHLIQNPSKVLIILDGFDECSEQHRKQIASDFEKKYPNDSKKEMPIPALCSKLIRGKLLRNAVVLVSSRPGKAEELGKIKFGRYVEISGFSPEQVIEYVDKYFGGPGKEQTRNDDTIPSEIRARGPEALKAYEEALESGKTKNRRLLIMVVGPARAGKTSLLKSLNGEKYDPKEDSTDGIQLQRTFCKSQENCWSKESTKGISYADCMADIIHKNLQGGDDSEEIHDKNFAKARLKESTEKSVESSESLSKNDDDDRDEDHDNDDDAVEDDDVDEDDEADDDDDAHGNDDDKMNAIKVESEEMNEEANEERENQEYISEKSAANLPKPIEEKLIKLMGSKMSDKTNRENEVYIKSLDFAGQAVYNVIHPIFLTSKAVFILVYNLKNVPHDLMKSIVQEDGAERELVDPFEMTNMENLELWLSCISSYTDIQRMAKIDELSLPPVFLAGTHADRFDGNLEAARKIIREIYKSLSPSKNPSGSHVVRNEIYTVNNSVSGNGEINDEVVRKLKADVEDLSKSLPHMNEDIPINWLWFEEELSNLVENENKKYITIDEALKIVNECKVNTSAESKEFFTLLNYLHDSKTVIYFEETKKVFIDTEWLVKVFTKVIEVRPVEKRDGFDESWDKLEEKGVLDRALVEHVWKGLVDERNTIDSLLLIMEKFSLICRWNTSEGEEVYLVPCMLCNSEKREDIAKCLEHEKSSTMVIRFNTSHVSLGIFPRLFVAIAEELKKIWPNLEKPELHKNFCRIFEIGKERNLDICIIQSSFQTICVTVCNIQNIDGQQVTEFCQDFRKLLDQIFDEMWRNFPWMQNMTFEYGILCPVCTTSSNKCKSHGMEGCTQDTCLHFVNEKELSVDTPKCKKYVANLDNVIEEKAYVYWFPRQAHQLQVEKFGRCGNFASNHKYQVPVTDLQETLNGMKPSIGAIIAINISNVPACGATCFRIGTKYVITNKHVIDDLCKSGIQSWSSCYVDFNYNERGQPGYRVDFAPNPVSFICEELDYVILEMCSKNGNRLPPSVTDLGYNIAPPGHQLKSGEYLTFIGHPGERRKQIDVTCPIKLQQDIQKDLHKYDASTVSLILEACNHPDHATYDVSTFFEGASGSPGILMEKKLLVVLHKGGFENRALEFGILMSSVVKDVMTKIGNAPIQNALDDIFGGSTSSIFDQRSLVPLSESERNTPTQILGEYPTPPGGMTCRNIENLNA